MRAAGSRTLPDVNSLDSMALPHTGPGRKRKGVRRPTQLLKVPPPLPLSSVPTAIYRTDCREHLSQPCSARSSGRTQQPIHSAPARTRQEFIDKTAD